jgi:hypothetical protein
MTFDTPAWAANVFCATDWELTRPLCLRQCRNLACSGKHYWYIGAELQWLAPRYAAWIDAHLVNDPDPAVAAENKAFIKRFYDLAAVICEWDELTETENLRVLMQTYSRIRKLLGIPIRKWERPHGC